MSRMQNAQNQHLISKTYKDVTRIIDHIHANRDITICNVTNGLGTSSETCHRILTPDVNIRQTVIKFVMSMCARSFRINFNKETPSSFKVIKGNKTLVYRYNHKEKHWSYSGTRFTLSPKKVQTRNKSVLVWSVCWLRFFLTHMELCVTHSLHMHQLWTNTSTQTYCHTYGMIYGNNNLISGTMDTGSPV